MDMQHGHGHGAWTLTCSIDMDLQYGHGPQFGLRRAARTWTCCMSMSMLHVPVHAVCPCLCCMPTPILHVHVHILTVFPCLCCMFKSMQHGHSHCSMTLVMHHGSEHAAWTWRCSMDKNMLFVHVYVHAACSCPLRMLHVIVCTCCKHALPMLHAYVRAACPCRCPCCMFRSMAHRHGRTAETGYAHAAWT
jgi:hypothetical protein